MTRILEALLIELDNRKISTWLKRECIAGYQTSIRTLEKVLSDALGNRARTDKFIYSLVSVLPKVAAIDILAAERVVRLTVRAIDPKEVDAKRRLSEALMLSLKELAEINLQVTRTTAREAASLVMGDAVGSACYIFSAKELLSSSERLDEFTRNIVLSCIDAVKL